MKTTSAPSLADLELALPIRGITDDLTALSNRLSLSAGSEKGYAGFAAEAFQISEIAERAAGHAFEITRFLALAGTSSRPQVALYLDMLIALSFLNAASTITVALAPPRLPAHIGARRRVLGDVIAATGGDAAFAAIARKAFAHGDIGSESDANLDAIAASGRDHARDDRPAPVELEHGLSLVAFLRGLASPNILVEQAGLQLDDADRYARDIGVAELDQERLDQLKRACHGASLLATADLSRARLANAVTVDDPAVAARVEKQRERLDDQRLRDVVVFAGALADRLRELRRMQREAVGGLSLL